MRKLISSFLSFFVTAMVMGQSVDSPVLLIIDDKPVTQAEFERIYTKNNQDPAFDKESLNEYMDLFINFKLKVIEAESMGMDTLSSFLKELNGYKEQLQKPYLTDPNADEELIKEAYGRMQWDIKASHILIRCADDALPADTLAAYNKIKDIRAKAIKKGANFEALAKKYSEDPSVKDNGGKLGYFTAFSMVYDFETAAYNTEVGKVSEILRTRYGYHILKVDDKRPDIGQIKVAHIMRSTPKGCTDEQMAEAKKIIYQVYDSLKAGADFTTMAAKYSDDRGTSSRGGELPYFGTGRMIPEFEAAAFALKENGDYSKPIQTSYGWHIIKRIDLKPLASFEELEPTIKTKISKDVRAQRGHLNLIASLKKDYRFAEDKKALAPFYTVVDSSIYQGAWKAEKAKGLNAVMFTLLDTIKFTQADFAAFIANETRKRPASPLRVIIDQEYARFVEESVLNYEKSILADKFPEYRNLLQEYHDGILLFNLSDEMVWSKAVKDTTGLAAFYEANKNNYMWDDRVEATVYTFKDSMAITQIEKMAEKIGKKNGDYIAAKEKFEQKMQAKDSTFTLRVVKNKYHRGENPIIDSLSWEPGLKPLIHKKHDYTIVYVNRKVAPEPKLLSEARGLITADYQTYLEKDWITELRNKHDVKINQEVFEQMIK